MAGPPDKDVSDNLRKKPNFTTSFLKVEKKDVRINYNLYNTLNSVTKLNLYVSVIILNNPNKYLRCREGSWGRWRWCWRNRWRHWPTPWTCVWKIKTTWSIPSRPGRVASYNTISVCELTRLFSLQVASKLWKLFTFTSWALINSIVIIQSSKSFF